MKLKLKLILLKPISNYWTVSISKFSKILLTETDYWSFSTVITKTDRNPSLNYNLCLKSCETQIRFQSSAKWNGPTKKLGVITWHSLNAMWDKKWLVSLYFWKFPNLNSPFLELWRTICHEKNTQVRRTLKNLTSLLLSA